MTELSKSQIDRLGDRFRKGELRDEDLRSLDSYRRSFGEAYELVLKRIRRLQLQPTGRPAKSTTSIVGKLQRESIRLSQMQDIAGCRVVVPTISEQDSAVKQLKDLFDKTETDDRRERPSHGYRAVHVIVDWNSKLIEIQIRTALQQAWAEVSEKTSDLVDPEIKYGRGNKEIVSALMAASESARNVELSLETTDTDRMLTNAGHCVEVFRQLGLLVRRVLGEK